jgi:hypothetical protein
VGKIEQATKQQWQRIRLGVTFYTPSDVETDVV